ncbi:MAG: HAD family hydrolase [Deltaproteobacteria bacterium]|nr:HAD family hydrolase [Deltaproteobacteria bacterium]
MDAAFFDLDRTLLTANSGRLWLWNERREGRLGNAQLLLGGWYLALYHLGLVDMEAAILRALETIRGLEEETVRNRTREWFDRVVAPCEAPGARRVLEDHRARGHRLVLLTTSSPYAAECALAHFGLDHALSMRYEVRDGRFTGAFIPPLCFGPGKVTAAEALAAREDLDLDRSWFYTDSYTDLPMLERVGHPRVVNPDPRLRRHARRTGWPVLDWR